MRESRVSQQRSVNLRLYRQYQQMLYAIWLGCEFAGDALTRWNRLKALYWPN